MSESLQKIKDYREKILMDLLCQCTKPQQDLFNRMYPGGVEEIEEERIDLAIQQCERTIKKNNLKKGIEEIKDDKKT